MNKWIEFLGTCFIQMRHICTPGKTLIVPIPQRKGIVRFLPQFCNLPLFRCSISLNTRRTLNVYKTFRSRSGRPYVCLLYVLCSGGCPFRIAKKFTVVETFVLEYLFVINKYACNCS